MTDRELMQQALEAVDWLRHHLTKHHGCLHMDGTASGIPAWLDKTETAMRGRLAQPDQWQGLTDEEINSVRHNRDWTAPWTDETFARAIEAKLREKNHG